MHCQKSKRSFHRPEISTVHLVACKKVHKTVFYKLSQGLKQKHETSFNRFLLLGVSGTDSVIAIFTYTQQESAELLRFCDSLTPGSTCALMRGKFGHKFIGSVSTTPILTTAEPLVPLNLKSFPTISCPRNVYYPDFLHFNIVTNSLNLSNVDAVSPVCNGVFSDGQLKGECPCLEVNNRKKNKLTAYSGCCLRIIVS